MPWCRPSTPTSRDVTLEGAAAGIHALLRLPSGYDDREVAAAAERAGVRVFPLSPFSLSACPDPGLVIGYGRLPAAQVEEAVRVVRGVLDQLIHGRIAAGSCSDRAAQTSVAALSADRPGRAEGRRGVGARRRRALRP